MRISHSKSGLRLQLTRAEHQLLGAERVTLSLHPHATHEFLSILPTATGGRALCANTGNKLTHPWRVQWEDLPELRHIPYFSSEEVEPVLAGAGLAVPRPPMVRPPKDAHRNKLSTVKSSKTAESLAALGGLEDLVDGINEYKRRLGNNLVLEVTQDGFLRTLVQFGRR